MLIAFGNFTLTLENGRHMFQENLQDSQFEHILGLVSRNPFIFVGGVPGVCSNLLSGAAGSGGWYKSTSCFSWTSGSVAGVGRLAVGLNRCFNFHPCLLGDGEMIQFDVRISSTNSLGKTHQLGRFQCTPPHILSFTKTLGVRFSVGSAGWIFWLSQRSLWEVATRKDGWIETLVLSSEDECRTL